MTFIVANVYIDVRIKYPTQILNGSLNTYAGSVAVRYGRFHPSDFLIVNL